MTTRIIIARHGNTFAKDETPRRVGGRTDLDLVEEERGRNVGRYLKAKGLIPALVFCRSSETDRQYCQTGDRGNGRRYAAGD